MPAVTFDVLEGALSALRLSPTEFVKEMLRRRCSGTRAASSRSRKRRGRWHEPRGVH